MIQIVSCAVVSILLLVACLCLGYLAFRRVRLMRGGGVDVCLRRRPVSSSGSGDATAGWHFGQKCVALPARRVPTIGVRQRRQGAPVRP